MCLFPHLIYIFHNCYPPNIFIFQQKYRLELDETMPKNHSSIEFFFVNFPDLLFFDYVIFVDLIISDVDSNFFDWSVVFGQIIEKKTPPCSIWKRNIECYGKKLWRYPKIQGNFQNSKKEFVFFMIFVLFSKSM